METSKPIVTIVAEDSTHYLVTVQDASGESRAPHWVSKFTFPPSLANEWERRREEADKLIRMHQSDQNMKETIGTDFINVYYKPDTVWAIIDEPAELALWAALTSRHAGGETMRLATNIAPVSEPVHEPEPKSVVPPTTPPLSAPSTHACHRHITRATTRAQKLLQAASPSQESRTERDMVGPEAETTKSLHSSSASFTGEACCNDLQLLHEETVTVFKCTLTQHGEHDVYSCTSCSSDAVLTLTPAQQDVYDFGAIFPLCDKCGQQHVMDDIAQRICDCLMPETKCSTCTWWTLNGLASTKQRAKLRTFNSIRCFDCRVLLRGDEKIGKCSLCCGLQVDE